MVNEISARPMYVIGLFDKEGELKTFFASNQPDAEPKIVKGVLKNIGLASLGGSVEVVSLPSNLDRAKAVIHCMREEQFNMSEYSDNPIPVMSDMCGRRAELMTALLEAINAVD